VVGSMVMSRPSAAKKPFFLPSQIGAVSTIGMTPTLILVRPDLPPAAGLALLEAPHALRATTETVASPTNIDVLIDRFMRHSIVAGTLVLVGCLFGMRTSVLQMVREQRVPVKETRMTSVENGYVSSSLVKEIATFGGDVTQMVPAAVARRLAARIPRL